MLNQFHSKWVGYKYAHSTGNLFRNKKFGNNCKIGVIGRLDKDGYLDICHAGKHHRCHRIAYEIFHRINLASTEQIDHIDGNRRNNRISNLRRVSIRGNALNKNIHREGRLKGVYFHIRDKKWVAQISYGGRKNQKKIFLGYYPSEQEAHQAYLKYVAENFVEGTNQA